MKYFFFIPLLLTTVLHAFDTNQIPSTEALAIPTSHDIETLEQSKESPPIVTIHFDPSDYNTSQQISLNTKGVFVQGRYIFAPAEDVIATPGQLYTLPHLPANSKASYYCHDQGLKTISHISITPEPVADEYTELRSEFRPITILRTYNERNFNGTSTLDALLCHKIVSGIINPLPSISVISLSPRAIKTLPAGMPTAKLRTTHQDAFQAPPDSSFLQFKNGIRIQTPLYDYDDSYIQELQTYLINNADSNNTTQPAAKRAIASLSQTGDLFTLNAIINNGELITEFPSAINLPSYQSRHPLKSALWKASSPFTGTVMHTVGIDHLPGVVAAGSSLLFATESLTLGALLAYGVTMFTDAVTVTELLAAGTTLFFVHGLYRWGTSEY
ncbi:hypothetical protein [uncultured Endozoicomonas sp.]|uniref:hypothetical protein n=1 Tax=uncultured Endozoicomonas sp. TaxID=432652 RepID=UPI002624676A|nr:hypothetical protein [uncultured Endozoicomonas sp.]